MPFVLPPVADPSPLPDWPTELSLLLVRSVLCVTHLNPGRMTPGDVVGTAIRTAIRTGVQHSGARECSCLLTILDLFIPIRILRAPLPSQIGGFARDFAWASEAGFMTPTPTPTPPSPPIIPQNKPRRRALHRHSTRRPDRRRRRRHTQSSARALALSSGLSVGSASRCLVITLRHDFSKPTRSPSLLLLPPSRHQLDRTSQNGFRLRSAVELWKNAIHSNLGQWLLVWPIYY